MRTFSNLVVALVLGIGVAAAGWLLLRDPGAEPADPGTAPVPRAAEPVAEEPVAAEPGALPPREEVVVEPPHVEPPAPEVPEEAPPPPAFLYPEQLKLEVVRFDDVPVRDVLLDVARQARLELKIPAGVEPILAGKRVTLDLSNTTGALVIARVLQPHGLNFTVRDGTVRIFVDDD